MAEHCPSLLVTVSYQCRVHRVVDAGTITGSQPRLLWDGGTMFPRELSLPHLFLRLSPQKHDLSPFCSFVLLRYVSDMPPWPASDTGGYPCFTSQWYNCRQKPLISAWLLYFSLYEIVPMPRVIFLIFYHIAQHSM